VVVLGLALAFLAERRHIAWLRVADPLAALAVAGFAIYITVRLGKRSVEALVDTAPPGTLERIAEAVSKVPGVLRQDRIRARKSGNQLFVDLRLTLQSNIPFEHAKSVMNEVESAVTREFPGADVVVHAEPREPGSADVVEKIRSIAHRQNLQVHDVVAYGVNGRVNASLDLELDPSLRLDEAHARATTLENAVKHELPQIQDMNIHLEPFLKRVQAAAGAGVMVPEMDSVLRRIALETPGVARCNGLDVHRVGEEVVVTLQCALESHLSVARVHDITEDIEFRFRQAFPQISKVSIHAEPQPDLSSNE
jgi:divalent metal cation (Fe/Co/Zn/Cd) transporter